MRRSNNLLFYINVVTHSKQIQYFCVLNVLMFMHKHVGFCCFFFFLKRKIPKKNMKSACPFVFCYHSFCVISTLTAVFYNVAEFIHFHYFFLIQSIYWTEGRNCSNLIPRTLQIKTQKGEDLMKHIYCNL